MDPESELATRFFAALTDAGLPPMPEFSVVPRCQVIQADIVAQIARFIAIFDRVTAREAWRMAACRDAPEIARTPRPETCFFSDWDFHLPPAGGCQLIEFNDNGSGFLFAAIINAVYHGLANPVEKMAVRAPADLSTFGEYLVKVVEHEAASFRGERPAGQFLILDDARSLDSGRFRDEHRLLCELFRRHG